MREDKSGAAGADVGEIEGIYRRSGAAFERVAIAITSDEHLGLDAVSEAFSRAIRTRRQFRREGPLEAWIWRIVVNEAKRLSPRREVPTDAQSDLAAADTFGLDDRDLVRARIAALPEQQRHALFLRYYADLDYAAIAVALGIAPGSVAATLHAAHKRLAGELQEVKQ